MTPAAETQRHTLEHFFREHYERLKGGPVPPFSIQFYPYRNLNHTIRIRQGRILVRLSDVLADAPLEVVTAILAILLGKLFRKPVAPSCRETYRRYILLEPVRQKTRRLQQMRGQKHLTSPRGRFFDLAEIFAQLNDQYFSGSLQVRRLSWSRQRSIRTLGHYDPAHGTIVVSRRLDEPSIPRCVVEYVVYHEMLHAFLGDRTCDGRRRAHHRAFREAEPRFEHHAEAQRFLRSPLP